MKANVDDYLVYRDPDKPKKNHLMKMVKEKDTAYKGVLEEDKHLEVKIVTIPKKSILVNLGPFPKPGVVYGVDVRDIYLKSFTHPIWGDIYFFTKLDKPTLIALRKELDHTGNIISKNGMEPLFDHLCIEIRTARGKHAGLYKHSTNKEKPCRIKLFLKEDFASQMAYVLFHEFGHAIRFNCLTNPKVVSSWLHLFNTSIPVEPVTESEFSKMFQKIKKAEAESLGAVKALFSEEDEEDLLTLKTAVRFISQVHKVKPREVSTLMAAGKFDTLEDLWPQRDIDVNDLNPIVSEYAGTNVEELFAEAYSFYMTKKKLPKSVVALLEKSLSVAKTMVKHIGVADE
jgi:uncharacterized protein (DUF2132 family)